MPKFRAASTLRNGRARGVIRSSAFTAVLLLCFWDARAGQVGLAGGASGTDAWVGSRAGTNLGTVAAEPFVLDLSSGPVVFDFENELEPWWLDGPAVRLPTDALGGGWAVFTDGGLIRILLESAEPFAIQGSAVFLDPLGGVGVDVGYRCETPWCAPVGSPDLPLTYADLHPSTVVGTTIGTNVIRWSLPGPPITHHPDGSSSFEYVFDYFGTLLLTVGPVPRGFLDNVTFVSVPEPEAATLLISAAVALALLLRRRRGSSALVLCLLLPGTAAQGGQVALASGGTSNVGLPSSTTIGTWVGTPYEPVPTSTPTVISTLPVPPEAFVLDFSDGPVVFDFENELEPWELWGHAVRVPTDALGGEWAIFGDGGHMHILVESAYPFAIQPGAAFPDPLDDVRIGLEVSCSGGVCCAVGSCEPPYDPSDLGTAIGTTTVRSYGFEITHAPDGSASVVDPLELEYFGRVRLTLKPWPSGFLDDITFTLVPEPSGMVLVGCALAVLVVLRRGNTGR